MTDKASMPWDCPDTYGKNTYSFKEGQAHLCQWPLKMTMIPALSPYFHRAHLLVAADCTAFSYSRFHMSLLEGRVLIIGCPETDGDRFTDKLGQIIRLNDIMSIAVVRMDAPCCQCLASAVVEAVRFTKKDIPIQITTVFAEGEIIS
jgi:hypothetical protein